MNTMNRVALVTGSSRGIGRAVAAQLAREGYAVGINYYERQDKAEGLCQKLYDKGDLTEPEMNKARLNTVVAKADRQRAADERAAVMARLRALNGGLSFVCNDTVYSLPADDLCRAAETRSLPRTAAVEGAEAAVAEAFARAAENTRPAEPLDWQDTVSPRLWETADGVREYDFDALFDGNPEAWWY